MNDDITPLTHEALHDLRNDIKRDAAAERTMPQDQGVGYRRDAEDAEAMLDVTRHHDAR